MSLTESIDAALRELNDLGDPTGADHLRHIDQDIFLAEQRVKDAVAHLNALKKTRQDREAEPEPEEIPDAE